MWDLPRPGIEPMSPALGGRFFTMEALGTRNAQEYFSNIDFKTILLIVFSEDFFLNSYSFTDNVRCHSLCVWCVSVYLHSDSYKFIYEFCNKFCFLVFHFHDIDLELFIFFLRTSENKQ